MKWLTVPLLVLLLVLPAQAGNSSDARKAWRALIDRAAARHGVHHRSLVLVPLVLKAAADPEASGSALPVSPEALSWSPVAGARAEAAVSVSTKAAAGALAGPKLLPSGLVLRHGRHERLLLRPTLLAADATAELRTIPLTSKEEPPPDAGVVRRYEGIAPPEYGHTLFMLPRRAVLHDLLALEALLLGRDPAGEAARLVTLYRIPAIVKRIDAAVKALAPIGKAYGGATVGHVAYLGGRPIQFVLAPAPATYASYMQQALRGLALAVIVWEELYARSGLKVAAPAWSRYLAAGEALLQDLAQVTAKREKRADERGAAGELWRMRETKNRRGRKTSDVGWLLLDEKGRPVWIEAWPEGTVGPLPRPTSTPGGPCDDDDPDAIKQGSLTQPFLERLEERWRKLRRMHKGH